METESVSDATSIRVGISACLLGEKVRYDGGHKEDRFLTGTVTQFVEFARFAPKDKAIGESPPRISVNVEHITAIVAHPDGGTLRTAGSFATRSCRDPDARPTATCGAGACGPAAGSGAR